MIKLYLFIKLTTIFFLLNASIVQAQQYEVLYANLSSKAVDTSEYELSDRVDTLGFWIFRNKVNKSIFRQTDESPAEFTKHVLNKKTGDLDTFITYNMSKDDVTYIDHDRNYVKEIKHFFDLEYVIEDTLPKYKWILQSGQKSIESFPCKRALTTHHLGNGMVYEVWYTEDIPLSAGPGHLNGLPGLILEVNVNGRQQYRAIEIQELKDENYQIEKPNTEGFSITFEEYQKIRLGVPFKNKNVDPPNR